MWDFLNSHAVGVFIAFCFLMVFVYEMTKLVLDRNKPIVECDCDPCDCNCHNDYDDDDDDDCEEEETM